jgi:hypothetical protein
MFKTKLSSIFALVAVLSLLLTPVAYAAGEGTAPGSFGAASAAPTVESIEIYRASDNTVASSMTPQVLYYAKLNITSINQLRYLKEVKATLYYDSTGAHSGPGAANTQTCAILTWTAAGDTWAINTGGPTTWAIVGGDSSHPDVTPTSHLTNGDWIFYFIPGKVATRAPETGNPVPRWDAQGIATNNNNQPSTAIYLVTEKTMECYIEISVNGGVNWGDVPLGLTFENATYNPQPHTTDNVTITYIANGNYESDIKSDNWTAGSEIVGLSTGDPPSNPGEFALKAFSSNTPASAVVVTSGYTPMDQTGTITPDVTGTPISGNRLWLSLSTTGILPGLYSGTIWYQIGCR